MSLDALASSHPISQPVTHTNQIKEIFDSITYNKVRLSFIEIHSKQTWFGLFGQFEKADFQMQEKINKVRK